MRWFPNRWPAMPDGRCEVILYTPDHDATFWSLGPDAVRKVVDLWAERSERLGAREDISYVLVFENRGAEVGATITHPHGQIYAFDFVPAAPLRELEHGRPFDDPGERLVATCDGWRAWVPVAPVFPFALLLVPDEQVPDLPTLGDAGRRGLAEILVDVLGRLDRMFAAQTPYMLWIHQRPFDGGEWPGARLHVEIVSPWRAPRRAPLHRRRRARLGCLLQSGGTRGGRGVAARGGGSQSMTTALDRLLVPRRAAELGVSGAPEPEPTACAGHARLVPDTGRRARVRRRVAVAAVAQRCVGVQARRSAGRCGSRGPGAARLGPRSTCPVCGRCRGTSSRTTRTS